MYYPTTSPVQEFAAIMGILFVCALLWWFLVVVTRKERKYEEIEIAALDNYVKRKKPETWLFLQEDKNFKKQLEKELMEDYFGKKTRKPKKTHTK